MVELDAVVAELSDLRDGITNVEHEIGACRKYLMAIVATNQQIARALEARNKIEKQKAVVSITVDDLSG